MLAIGKRRPGRRSGDRDNVEQAKAISTTLPLYPVAVASEGGPITLG
jgi:hypothetical protein